MKNFRIFSIEAQSGNKDEFDSERTVNYNSATGQDRNIRMIARSFFLADWGEQAKILTLRKIRECPPF